MNAPATIGHNQPPPDVLFDGAASDLLDMARDWLDGAPIKTAEEAEAVGRLLTEAREIEAGAEAAREAEKAPHLAAGRAVDEKWKPIKADAVKVKTAAGAAITAWNMAERARLASEARAMQEAADAAAAAALEAHKAANPADLAAREAADAELARAAQLNRDAEAASKAKAQVSAGDGKRAVGLVVQNVAVEITDVTALLKWAKVAYPDELKAALFDLAKSHKGTVPGIRYEERGRAA